MQILTSARKTGGTTRRYRPDADAVDAVLTASRSLIESILATLPEDAQRAVAESLHAFADAAGEVPDSQWPSPVPAGEAPRPPVPGHRGHTDAGDRA
jgi:hypothetical protein